MTTPNDAPSEPSIDITDPRWVDDVLARARRRAEEARRGAAPAGTAPTTTAPPTTSPDAARAPEFGAARLTEPQPSPRAEERAPGDEPVVPTGPQPTAGAGGHEAAPARPAERAVDPAGTPPARRPVTPSFAPGGEAPARRRIEITPIDDAVPAASNTTPVLETRPPGRNGTTSDDVDPAPTADPATDTAGDTPGDTPGDHEVAEERGSHTVRTWLEWAFVIACALLVAFLIRTVAFQAFYIPSESMEHTLEVKDRILVNKLSYKLHDVNRGDIIVFEKPPGETSKINDLIKRVIALPGETIEQQGRDIYIDRGEGPQKLTESYINDPNDTGPSIVWVQGCANPSTEATRCTIPDGHVWVMGDNRGHSHDSRMFGPIDQDLIVGRAFLKVWPLGKLGFL